LPTNFNWPFLAANLTEFWRRWHISLSTWLRDYLFIPMGGSRVPNWKLKRNLFITMALGGLWHGADWHYVIWGMFHGAGLVVSKDWSDMVDRTPWLKSLRPTFLWHCSGVAFTFTFLIFACVLFRAADVPQALHVASRMFTAAPSYGVVHAFFISTLPYSLSAYALFLAGQKLGEYAEAHPMPLVSPTLAFWNNSLPTRLAAYVTIAIAIMGFAPEEVAPFIYFQF
jgi:D-alanyl-lipoteichoic acid acyltransferase DltB (MBOAT superfamily)